MRFALHDGMALPTLNDLYETTGLGGAIGCSKPWRFIFLDKYLLDNIKALRSKIQRAIPNSV